MTRRNQLSMTLICSLCFILLMTLGAAGPTGAIKPADAMPPLTIQGQPYTGEFLGVHGFGFRARETVVIFLDGVSIGSTTARQAMGIYSSDLGYIQTNVRIPDDTINGDRILQAAGQTTGHVSMVTITVKSDWAQAGRVPAGTHNNASDLTISPANVAQLTPFWQYTGFTYSYKTLMAAHGKVYATNQNNVMDVFAESTGAHLTQGTGGWIDSAFMDGAIIATSDRLRYYDAATLALRHSEFGIFSSAPVIADGLIYNTGPVDANGFLHTTNAFNLSPCPETNCGAVWSFQSTDPNAYFVQSPAVANGVVYAEDLHGNVFALNATTGALLWSAALGSGTRAGSIAVADGYVFVASIDNDASTHNGKLYAFNANGCGAATCAPLWSSSSVVVGFHLAVGNGVVFVAGQDNVPYAFGEGGCGNATCAPLWHGSTTGTLVQGFAVANGVLYASIANITNGGGTQTGQLYAFATSGCGASACASLWSASFNRAVTTAPILANGVVYVGADHIANNVITPNVYAFHLPSGATAKKQPTATVRPARPGKQ